jgi:5'-phosphate synthase pdxT subunit
MIGILALQGDFEAHRNAFSRLDVPTRLVRRPSDLSGLDGLVLPGGESSTFLRLLDSEGLWEPVEGFSRTHPVWGTCAGAILMADRVDNPSQRCLGLIRMTIRRNAYGRQLSSSIRNAQVSNELVDGNGSTLRRY